MSSSSPVEFTSYADALDFWNSSNDKIKVKLFTFIKKIVHIVTILFHTFLKKS
jgi:hypothetical protein